MRRAIITGATGAIGSALIRELLKNDIEVLVFTRKDSKRNNVIPKHDLLRIRYFDLDELCNIQNDDGTEYDIFYHLAWAGTSGSGRNDRDLQEKNITYTLDAVRCAKRFSCRKFVGVGSQAEYGRKQTALKPQLSCEPENEYGRAKLIAGQKAEKLAHELNMAFNWVRVLSIYGPNDNENSLISYAIRELSKQKIPAFTPCEQIWDYLYSEDAAKAFLKVGEKGIDGKTYVLGSGTTKTLKEYLQILRDVIAPGMELGFGLKPYPEHQVMYLRADISDLTKDTGFLPETDFAEGIKKIVHVEKA